MLRALGMLAVVLCGIFTARILNASAAEALSESKALIAFLRFVRSEIECYGMPTPQIIKRCPRDILKTLGAPDVTQMQELGEKNGACDSACREILSNFCCEIGKGYRAEQLKLCDYYIHLAEQRHASVVGGLSGRKKINSALCVAGALAIVIILY